MRSKDEILHELQQALRDGTVSNADIAQLAGQTTVQDRPTVATQDDKVTHNTAKKISAIDAMFYSAGLIFFVMIMSIVVQMWSVANNSPSVILTGTIGLLLWGFVYYLTKKKARTDIQNGLSDSLLLTGSLLLIAAGYIMSMDINNAIDSLQHLVVAVILLMLGLTHLLFSRFVAKSLPVLMGIVLTSLALAVALVGTLYDAEAPFDLMVFAVSGSALVAMGATRFVAKHNSRQSQIGEVLDVFALFVVLGSCYIATYSGISIVWFAILLAVIVGLFYMSIITRKRRLLGLAVFFLIITILTIAFRYFSGYGATLSLVVATIGVLMTASVAVMLDKKYFSK